MLTANGPQLRVKAIIGAVTLAGLCLIFSTGCREEPPAPPASSSAPAEQISQPKKVEPRPASPAAPAPQEESQGPPYLPAHLPIEGWTRQEPVRSADAAGLSKLLPPSQAVWVDHFRIKSAASCGYVCETAGREITARAVVFETQSSEDAYGLMSCQSSSSEVLNVGGETRVETGVELHFHCWQGESYAHVWTEATDEKAVIQTRRLLMHIVGRIPRSDPPSLVEVMPREAAKPGQRWLLRNLSGLPATVFAHPAGLDLEEVAKLLGLSDETLMCISSYDVPEGRKANTVWVVRYPSAKAAEEAYARYSKRIAEAATGSPWQSTLLHPPQGPYLLGTWTAEEESIQYMLPRIEQLLPVESSTE